jgi:DNA primase
MPGIDFNKLRQEITMEQVLNLLDFEPTQRSGDQWYGPCPLHASTSNRPRHFSVNVALGRYRCHKCHSQGNQLELWAAFTRQSLYQAAINLCHQLGREVPWVRRW